MVRADKSALTFSMCFGFTLLFHLQSRLCNKSEASSRAEVTSNLKQEIKTEPIIRWILFGAREET
jgi:hypothetical protein